jgi:hypothetical protein
MGRNSFEYNEMLAIISRVRKKGEETCLRYSRLFFSMYLSVFEYPEYFFFCFRYVVLFLKTKNGIIDYYVKNIQLHDIRSNRKQSDK